MKKRLLPLLLAVIALFSLLPTVALAATTTGSSISYTTSPNQRFCRMIPHVCNVRTAGKDCGINLLQSPYNNDRILSKI